VWEHSILPLLSDLIKQHCTGDFAVDVHNFPERSSEAVPRVIYITLPADMNTALLEPAVRLELEHAVPERFNPVYLKFRKGDLQRSQWWYVHESSHSRPPLFSPTPFLALSFSRPLLFSSFAMVPSFSRLLRDVVACPQRSNPLDNLSDGCMHDDGDVPDLTTSPQGRRRNNG
jgi:hypothetical protein